MAWEQRGGGSYYYRKRREGERVVSEYVGAGLPAEAIAELDALDREQRKSEQEAWRRERAEVEAIDREVAEVQEIILTLTRAWLLAGGWHTHKGQWRRGRKREQCANC